MTDPVALIKHLLSGGALTDGTLIVSFSKIDMVRINGLVTTNGSAIFDMIGNRVDITLSDLIEGRWEIYWPLDNNGAMEALANHHYVESSKGDTYVLAKGLMVYDKLNEEFVPCKDNPFTPETRWEVQE